MTLTTVLADLPPEAATIAHVPLVGSFMDSCTAPAELVRPVTVTVVDPEVATKLMGEPAGNPLADTANHLLTRTVLGAETFGFVTFTDVDADSLRGQEIVFAVTLIDPDALARVNVKVAAPEPSVVLDPLALALPDVALTNTVQPGVTWATFTTTTDGLLPDVCTAETVIAVPGG